MSEGQFELLTAFLVSMFGIVNVLITVIISPITSEKNNNVTFKKEKLYENTVELVEYVSDAVRIQHPKQKMLNSYRKYCLQIHLLFIHGTAYDPVSNYMEDIYRVLYWWYRDTIVMNHENRTIVRNLIRKIRVELAYYIEHGVSRPKRYNTKEISVIDNGSGRDVLVIGELESLDGIFMVKYIGREYIVQFFHNMVTEKFVYEKTRHIIDKYSNIRYNK